jgi:prephenate dehydrogenase
MPGLFLNNGASTMKATAPRTYSDIAEDMIAMYKEIIGYKDRLIEIFETRATEAENELEQAQEENRQQRLQVQSLQDKLTKYEKN